MSVDIRVVPDPPAAAARLLVEAAAAGGAIAVSGGNTAGAAYEAAADADWSRAEIWFGDDRAVPPEDDRSNYKLVHETLLRHVTPAAVHRIECELGAEEAAARYDRLAAGLELALALNGIGPDGHTASLFPNAESLDADGVVAVEGEFEPYVPRVTMTIPLFARAELLVYLVTGADKADAVARAFATEPSRDTPASLVRGRRTIAVLDEAAAANL